ncbi:Rap1a/Tai family immunity protein [Rhizobium sp. CB3171]|uniref:Rap1a/Tai family immunity protein n=1 Tax=Rhizobium sp. CB3171 TaxID=3039157 RepID=UPI0024B247FA|nr:Rap1a/Tai family immunity protein [Rhizobium sp. CB3171]WFU01485.1 Rap1a/Tai family immunity protein [Rhizobium sp. CB3171]
MSGIVVATLLAVISSKSPVGFSDGSQLLADCRGSRQFANGYVIGWLDKWNRDEYIARRGIAESIPNARAMTNWAYFGGSVGIDVCIPANVDTKKISNMICDFLIQNPSLQDVPAEDIMNTFTGLNFPCDRK